MDFFDDEATGQIPATPPPPRRRTNRRRNQILRLVIGIAVIFVILVLLVFWIRSCQQNRKETAYRSYLEAVATAIDDSNALGKNLEKIVADPTKYDHNELKTQVQGLVTQQEEIATRVARLDHPGTLDGESARAHRGNGGPHPRLRALPQGDRGRPEREEAGEGGLASPRSRATSPAPTPTISRASTPRRATP